MVRHAFLALLTSIFVGTGAFSQSFDRTFDLDINYYSMVETSAEIQQNRWVSAVSLWEDTLSYLVFIQEVDTHLSATTVAIESEDYRCVYCRIVPEWSDSNKVVGIGTALNKITGDSLLISWKFRNSLIEIIPLISDIGEYIYTEPMGFDVLPSGKELIVPMRYLTGSSSYSLYYCVFDQSFKIKSQDTLTHEFAEPTSDFCLNNTHIYIARYMNVIYSSSLTNLSEIDTFWSKPMWTFTDTGAVRLISSIAASDDYLYVSGSVSINRSQSGSNRDDEPYIYQLDFNGKEVNTFYFGMRDTTQPLKPYLDDVPGTRSLNLSKTGYIFFAITSNFANSTLSEPYEELPTWLHLFKLDENLNTIWHFIYSDTVNESRIINHSVLPTSDDGVIAFNYKYNYKAAPENGLDLHILRLKADGTPYTLSIPLRKAAQNSFSLYPNPANGLLHLNGNTDEVVDVIITDMAGRETLRFGNANSPLNISSLAGGTYVVEIHKTDGQRERLKLVVN